MSLWPLPLLRRRGARPRARHRLSPISCCGPCRTGNLRRGHPRGADGRRGPGSGACLGRRYQLRRPPLARRGGHRHCGLSVPAVLGRGQAPGRGRPAPSLAACRAHHRRGRAALRLPRKCRPSSPPRLPRSRRRTGRHGLPPCGGPLHGGGSRRAPQARAAVHPRDPRGRRTGRPRAPAPGPGRVAGTGRNCCGSGRRRRPTASAVGAETGNTRRVWAAWRGTGRRRWRTTGASRARGTAGPPI